MSKFNEHKRHLYTRLAMRVVLTLVIAYTVLFAFSAYSIWTFGQNNQVATTDAAIVLGAAVTDNQPSPVLRERIQYAVWLYKQGLVGKLICTGGADEAGKLSEAEVARQYAIEQGVQPSDIFTDTTSRWTTENIQHAAEIASRYHLKTFTIVSDPLHMKRAMLIAEVNGLKAYSSPTTTSAYTSFRSQIPMLLRETLLYTGYLITIPFR
ncbi:YdcF family protein [Paenibacillus campi]|uniref:YdcF family protein n=1 Tax=Paenibacillus campi TaxID=3106031 RepID=UPI002AFF16C2|nr:YdcF family protein [Paenibacillus sp. SGZ-1014]